MTAPQPDLFVDPFPWMAMMRAQQPVFKDPQHGVWHVFRYADVKEVFTNHALFSSSAPTKRSEENLFGQSMITSDPPYHRKLRSLTSNAFTPRMIEGLAPRISAIVDEHLAAVAGQAHWDGVMNLAYPLPVIVIAEMLGIPVADREQFKHWTDVIISSVSLNRSETDEVRATYRDMGAYFMQILAQRKVEPGPDLISALCAAEVDGEQLTDRELLGFCALLLIAGNETTTNLLANAFYCIDEQPELWDQLRANRELVPSFIEEALRFRSPVKAMFRYPTRDVELGGQTIPAQSIMLGWLGSANRDETVFEQADRFVIDRAPNHHLAFGHGIHYCLGAPLARLEGKIAINALLDRYTHLRRDHNQPATPVRSPITFGWSSLPLAVEA